MKKFIVSSQILKQVLHKLGLAVNTKTVLPVLSNVYIKVTDGQLELITSDLETTIIYRTEAETSGEGFEFLMSYQLLSKITTLSKNVPLTFSLEKKGIKITGDNDVYELKSLEKIEEYPTIPELPKKNNMQFDDQAIGWLNTALQTVSKDDSRPATQKVLLELKKDQTTIASTDSSYMVFSYSLPLPAPAEDEILISPKVIKAIEDLKEVKFFWHAKTYGFESNNITVIVTRPEGKFPNFRAIIPDGFDSNVTINRLELISALQKCDINTDSFKEMSINLGKKGKIAFNSKDTSLNININVEVEGTYTGTVGAIKCSSEKMLKLMQQVDFEEIEFAIHDAKRPLLFRSANDKSYLALLMPIHSNDN